MVIVVVVDDMVDNWMWLSRRDSRLGPEARWQLLSRIGRRLGRSLNNWGNRLEDSLKVERLLLVMGKRVGLQYILRGRKCWRHLC